MRRTLIASADRTVEAVDGIEDVAKLGVAEVRHDLRARRRHRRGKAERVYGPAKVAAPLRALERQALAQRGLVHLQTKPAHNYERVTVIMRTTVRIEYRYLS